MARRRGNGEGSIRHDIERDRWEARFTVGYDERGRQIRKKVTAPTRVEVVRRLNEAMRAADQSQQPANADLTVATFLKQWLTDVLPGTVAPSTEVQYGDVIRLYVSPIVGRKRLRSLTARDVSAMVRQLADAGRAPNTQRLARTILRRALRWAEHEGLSARNPAAIGFGPRVPTPEGRTMTTDDVRALLDEIRGHRLEAAWVTMLGLGLRRGELLGLAWDDIDLRSKTPTLSVRRSLKRLPRVGLIASEPKTRQSRRVVHLPSPVAAVLRDHRTRQAVERLAAGPEWVALPLGLDLVFRSYSGSATSPDGFSESALRATERAGLGQWSPHELRHSASLLLAEGVPLKVVSELLGHSSIRVTADVYGHLLEPSKAEAAEAMGRVLGG